MTHPLARRFPRPRGGYDDRARRLLVFGFEVLSDDAVFLNRGPREGVATASVLTESAAMNPALTTRQVVLQARSVDEHVDLARPLPTVGKGLVRNASIRGTQVGEVRGDGNTRRKCCQIQEIVTRRWELLHLPRRHARGHLR